MQKTFRLLIKKEYAAAIIEDLAKLDAIEILPDIPQYQIDEIRSRKKHYKLHPEELVSWEDAQKLIKT